MTASWIIRDKETKAVQFETFNRRVVDRLNTERYEAIPIQQYLASLNNRSADDGKR